MERDLGDAIFRRHLRIGVQNRLADVFRRAPRPDNGEIRALDATLSLHQVTAHTAFLAEQSFTEAGVSAGAVRALRANERT